MENQTNLIFFTAITIWLAVLSYYLYRNISHYQNLIKTTGKENLMGILEEILGKLAENKKNIQEIAEALEGLKHDGKYHIQKVGLLRFNPFENSGGDQSFILAFLDGHDTGMILTSLHNRGTTRWFAKNVENGKGVDFQLSAEEEKTIRGAISIHAKRLNKLVDTKQKVGIT